MKRYPLYIFDLDGTLYRGEEALPHAVGTIKQLRDDGAQIRYLTNNSSKTRFEFAEKLNRLGFQATPEEVYTSAIGAAQLLKDKHLRSAFVVGEAGLISTLQDERIKICSRSEQAEAVVAGICWNFTFDWLNNALQQILGGAQLIATNKDATYPVENGRVLPGAGAIVASIEAASGMTAECVGKPSPFLIESILKETSKMPEDALVIGDRYETDIVSGISAGCDTLLVLTGVSAESPGGQPTIEDLRALL